MRRRRNMNILRCLVLCQLFLCLNNRASAHNGPPFRILAGQRVGSCLIDVWTHADVGTSSFWIKVSPIPGSQIPDDLKISVVVRPLSEERPDKQYAFNREMQADTVLYK